MGCVEQSGILKVILIENENISFNYPDITDPETIDAIYSNGITIELTEFESVMFRNTISPGKNAETVYNYEIEFTLLELASQELLEQIQTSHFGWVAVVEFLNGDNKFIPSPMFTSAETDFAPVETNVFNSELSTRVFSNKKLLSVDTGYTIGERWVLKFNHPTSEDGNCIFKIGESTVFAGYENGDIYKSSDDGINWELLTSGTSESIQRIFFLDESDGWFCADQGVLRFTTDGGLNWTTIATGTTDLLTSIKMIRFGGSDIGWIGRSATTDIFKIVDNVLTTQDLTDLFASDIAIIDENIVHVVGGTTSGARFMFKTIDGGDNWVSTSIGGGTKIRINAFGNIVWACSIQTPQTTKSVRGGEIFSYVNTTVPGLTTGMAGLYFESPVIGWLGDSIGVIGRTVDGENWEIITTPSSSEIKDIHINYFIDNDGDIYRRQ